MRLVITGGAGLLGRELVRAARGQVVATYNRPPVTGGIQLDIRDSAAAEVVVREVRQRRPHSPGMGRIGSAVLRDHLEMAGCQ
jgi:dTDP-4-dehydrorhamnose reductase